MHIRICFQRLIKSNLDHQNDSAVFYTLRGFAILSVAYAHSLSLQNEFLSRIAAVLGLVGVPIFMICSGYYYKHSGLNPNFFKNKIRSIVVPWLLWGTFAYVLSLYLNGIADRGAFAMISGWFLYLSGYETWLYYVPVYITIVLFFQIVHPSRLLLILCLIVTCISTTITFYFQPDLGLTPFQNPLNWIGFYAIGIALKYLGGNRILGSARYLLYSGVLTLVTASVTVVSVWKVCYWHPLSILFEISSFIFLFLISNKVNSNYLQIIGKNSYVLYFLHMQIGIAVTNRLFVIMQIQSEVIQLFIKPTIVISITMLLVLIINFVLKRLRLSSCSLLLGIKL